MTKLGEKSFDGKYALITGGAKGIGRACALKFAAHGCNVAINYYNSEEQAQAVVEEIRILGSEAIAIKADVGNKQSIAEMLLAYGETFPQIDYFISNAASGVLKPCLAMNVKHWRWCMEINALALNEIVRQAQSLLVDGGSIVALSSLGASRAIPQYGFIGASKAALEALVRSLSLELAVRDIRVNTVSAGVVDTDALKMFPNRAELLDQYQNRSLSGRLLTVEDVANAVYLLCLPESLMIRGQTLYVDAGYHVVG